MDKFHVIEKADSIELVNAALQEYESGDWTMAEVTAQRFVGGEFFARKTEASPSHFGGVVVGYRMCSTNPRKVVLRVRRREEMIGLTTDRDGWGWSTKFEWAPQNGGRE